METTTPDPAPETSPAGPGDPTDEEVEAAAFQDALDLLRDPRYLLAGALVRIWIADAIMQEGEKQHDREGPLFGPEVVDQAAHRTTTADTLAQIAAVAHTINRDEAEFGGYDGTGDDDDMFADVATDMAAGRVDTSIRPQPANGMRFRAEIAGQHLGTICGRQWLQIGGWYINVTSWTVAPAQEPDGGSHFMLSGRIVSATPGNVLVIDDGGQSHTLPRALITEMPDDQ